MMLARRAEPCPGTWAAWTPSAGCSKQRKAAKGQREETPTKAEGGADGFSGFGADTNQPAPQPTTPKVKGEKTSGQKASMGAGLPTSPDESSTNRSSGTDADQLGQYSKNAAIALLSVSCKSRQKRDLRCVLHPSKHISGGRCKTCVKTKMKGSNPVVCMIGVSGQMHQMLAHMQHQMSEMQAKLDGKKETTVEHIEKMNKTIENIEKNQRNMSRACVLM